MNTNPHLLKNPTDYRDTWRIFRIMAELVEGYNFLNSFSREITILGSARFSEDDRYYRIARELGGLLGAAGFTVMTGGGPGIMEAANRGAMEKGGKSVGVNIELPFEQRINPYVKESRAFYYFFTRKVMLTSPASAFVFFPGGFGTMDEFFEVVDNMELGMMSQSPVVLVGSEFWGPVMEFLRTKAVAVGSLSAECLDSWKVVDTAVEAFEIVKNVKDERESCDLSPNNFRCDGKIDWKIFRVMAELVEGFEFVSGTANAVTVLGTKSVKQDSDYYAAAHEIGAIFAEKGLAVVTGGKTGVAEAASKGAFERGGESIGIGMTVGLDKTMNSYLTKSINFHFPFTRKLIITAPTGAFVFFPGGLGTLHQLFEILTLIQTKKIEPLPVILFDHQFWQPLHEYIKKTMVHDVETISEQDDELYQIVDSVEAVVKLLTDAKKL